MAKYNLYQGTFACHTCRAEVKTLRFYEATKELTWMCNDKHVTIVDLNTKKSRKDYEREERE
jgi:hypothetical protein